MNKATTPVTRKILIKNRTWFLYVFIKRYGMHKKRDAKIRISPIAEINKLLDIIINDPYKPYLIIT